MLDKCVVLIVRGSYGEISCDPECWRADPAGRLSSSDQRSAAAASPGAL